MVAPKVSIIMPVYNAGIYLKDALNDILCQTYSDFEVICVDDGSTDKSRRVLDFFSSRDSRIKVFTREREGAGAARNFGIEEANGEYLLFLDADDRFEPCLLEKSVSKAEETQADIVVFDAQGFDSWSGLLHKERWIRKELTPHKEVFCVKDAPREIFLFTQSCAWNKFYRADFIKRKELFFQNYPYMNDVFFVLMSMATAEKITIIYDVLVLYRQGRNTSISSASSKSVMPEYAFMMLEDARNSLIKLGLFDKVWKSFANHALGIISSHMMACTTDNWSVFQERLSKSFLSALRLDILQEEDYVWKNYYKQVKALYTQGFSAFLAQQITDLNERLLHVNYEIEHGKIAIPEQKYFFDLGRIPMNSRIIIYGAGFRGKRIYELTSKICNYTIADWVDKKAVDIYEDAQINTPDNILRTDYDYIVIAVDDIDVAIEIKEELLKRGIDDSKIIW